MSQNLMLVTGASGFIGGHIVEGLLKHGFKVRGTLRSAKYQTFANMGVDGIIHAACPLPGKNTLDETFKVAIEDTLNVVRQAQRAGMKKIGATSSFGTVLRPTDMPSFHGLNFNETMWGELNDEELEKNKEDKYYVYFTAKIKAEKALWAFANEHPELEVATSPYAKTFTLLVDVNTMGTNDFVHFILNKGDPPFAPNWMVDVRDVAKAHVLALEKLPLPVNDSKRFLVNCMTSTWGNAATYIKNSRPELADRINPLEETKPLPGVLSSLDTTRAQGILGMTEFIPVERTLDDAVDAVLALKKHWSKAKN